MSHTSKVGLNIVNEKDIRGAVELLKNQGVEIELIEDAIPRMYFKHQETETGECDFVLKLNNSRYDVGLKYNHKTKKYDAEYDPWGDDIKNVIGYTDDISELNLSPDEIEMTNISKFMVAYTTCALTDEMAMLNNEEVMMSVNENGETVLQSGNEYDLSMEY